MPSSAPRRVAAAATATAVACALALTPVAAASAAIVPDPITHSAPDAALSLNPIGTFETGVFDQSAAEIVAAYGDRLFVVSAEAGAVQVLDFSDPTQIAEQFSITSDGVANSVAVREDGLGVIAFEAPEKTDPGHLVFFDANSDGADVLGTVTVGAQPDNVVISPDGRFAVSANEGEPADDFSTDPEGSVSVVRLSPLRGNSDAARGKGHQLTAPTQKAVSTADFHRFEGARLPEGVRVFGPTPHGDDLPVSRNLEPEYVSVVGNNAYVTLQEANAFAVVQLPSARVTDILPLGTKDYSQVALDPSDEDGPDGEPAVNLRTFPGLYGLYQPDGINSYSAGGTSYLVTANEGDAREWGDYSSVTRAKNLEDDGYGPVDPDSPVAAYLEDSDLGRLNVSIEDGFNEETGYYDELYTLGGRSFSIWTTDGEQVFDSGSDFEEVTAAAASDFFNSNHTESNLDGRSDDKGPEPENLTIGEVDGRTYAFIGFERVGGIAVYDITEPAESFFVTYLNNRDFSVSVEDDGEEFLSQAGDLGPEGLTFIPAEQSPTGEPLVAVANEVSGTTTLFEVRTQKTLQVLTINDFHGRIEQGLGNGEAGAAVVAGAVDQFEELNPNTLFVSSGDNIGASTFTSFINDDQPTIDALRESGLDLSVVGNHEFDQGFADLTDRVLPLYGGGEFGLGANVYVKGTDEPALQEYAIEEIDGVRVGFIGTVTPDTATMVTPTGIADIEFGDQLEAANRVADEIADETDVIVLLAHDGPATADQAAGLGADSDFAALVNGASAEVDAIVSGHTHLPYVWEAPVPGAPGETRPVIQAHQYGTTLGKLDIAVDSESKELLSIDASLVPLVADGEAAFPADPAVQSIVDAAAAEAEELGSVEVGSITGDVLRGGTPAGSDRGVESSLGNLVADVYLWATSNEDYAGTPAQIGIMNPGGLRADLLYGDDGTLTVRDVANVQPFANTLVTVTLTGEQLRSVLQEQWQPAGSARPKLHLGISEGLSYTYDEETKSILDITFQGEPVAPTDEFTVVTNSFLAVGGDNFFTFEDAADRTDTGQIDLTATVDYFAQNSPVDPAPLGRAVEVAP